MMTSTSVASLLAAILYQRNPDKERQAVEDRINEDIYSSYASAAGMLLHIDRTFTMGKLESSLLSQSLFLAGLHCINCEV